MVRTDVAKSLAGRVGGGIFKGIFRYVSWIFVFFFLIIPLIYAVLLSVNGGSIQPGLDYIIPKLINPLGNIYQISSSIVSNQGINGGLFTFFGVYFNLFQSLWIFYKWISLFALLVGIFLGDSSRKFIQLFIFILMFIFVSILQIVYLALNGLEIDIVWKAWIEFFKAVPYLVVSSNSIIDSSSNANINGTISNITNNVTLNKNPVIVY